VTDARRLVNRSRKELDQLVVPKWAATAVIAAAEWTTMLAPDYVHKLIRLQLSLCGKIAASLLVEDDKPILFLPASIVHAGADQGGAVLTTQTGAIFAWTEGRFRLGYFALAIPHAVVQSVETPPAPADHNATLRVVTSDETLVAHFATVRSDNGPTGFLDAIVASLNGEGSNGAT
jgi:hypothetical protein